jgi:hypothetical protein
MPSTDTIPDEINQLILQLAASIPPPEYDNFITAAHAVLTEIDCNHLGVGLAYRRLRELQRSHYDYPPDPRAAHGPNHYRPSKLSSLPPIGRPDRAEDGQLRNRFRRAG